MRLGSKWTPVPRFPVTTTIYEHVLRGSQRTQPARADIVSGELCDHILQRVSPYLRRNPPVDILDLWPGSGFWSSKVNDFLRPRRHVLIEPDLKRWLPLLKPVAASKPCYELLSMDIWSTEDWTDVMNKHLPEQGPSNRDTTGVLPRNDTLLVLANPPKTISKRTHYTAARWWSAFLETCMNQSGLHQYGSVRVLASFPLIETPIVLPRSVHERKRPGILTESLALHAFELAAPFEVEPWHTWKRMQEITDNAKRVAERTAAQNVVVPAGRERPPLPLAYEIRRTGSASCPHEPRVRTERHERLFEEVQSCDKQLEQARVDEKKAKALKAARSRAIAPIHQDNRGAYFRSLAVKSQLEIDALYRTLSYAAADPAMSPKQLKALDDQIVDLKSAAATQAEAVHSKILGNVERVIDDARAARLSNDSDESVLLWEQRPFEPLHITSEDLFPRGVLRSLVYFEANPDSAAMQKLQSAPAEHRAEVLGLFNSLSLIFGNHNFMSVTELFQSIFRDQSINDLVKAIPSLVPHAAKRIKPNAGPVPLAGASESLDPTRCYQENVDYDLSDCRIRGLPVQVLWDILLEYQKNSMNLSAVQFTRLLGGTLTSYRAGDFTQGKRKVR